MGFVQPEPPPFDIAEWKAKPYLERSAGTDATDKPALGA